MDKTQQGTDVETLAYTDGKNNDSWSGTEKEQLHLMYVCPCIIYEIDERYKTYTSAQDYTPAPQNLSHNT